MGSEAYKKVNIGKKNPKWKITHKWYTLFGVLIYYWCKFALRLVSLQIKALPAGLDNIVLVDEEVRRKTYAVGSQGGGGVDTSGKKWKTGELEFEALMRQLDNAVRTKIIWNIIYRDIIPPEYNNTIKNIQWMNYKIFNYHLFEGVVLNNSLK